MQETLFCTYLRKKFLSSMPKKNPRKFLTGSQNNLGRWVLHPTSSKEAITSAEIFRRFKSTPSLLKKIPIDDINPCKFNKIWLIDSFSETVYESSINKVQGFSSNGLAFNEVVFMFPGTGEQYLSMGAELYLHEKVYKEKFDECARFFHEHANVDLYGFLRIQSFSFKEETSEEIKKRLFFDEDLLRPKFAHPFLFATEYALAHLWMSWGVRPASMIGHSVGEYVAATIAGVFSLRDATRLVAARATVVDRLPVGSMIGVAAEANIISDNLVGEICIAAENAPGLYVVSGTKEEIADFQLRLDSLGIASRPLRTTHAFHSNLLKDAACEVRRIVSGIKMMEPKIPYVSNLTGDWITSSQATSPDYWAAHTVSTVKFFAGIERIKERKSSIYLEVGPGQTLSSFVKRIFFRDEKDRALLLHSLPGFQDIQFGYRALFNSLASLSMTGISISSSFSCFLLSSENRSVEMVDVGDSGVCLDTFNQEPPTVFSEVEDWVKVTWRGLLDVSEVESSASFFDLGGTSLLATRFIILVRQTFDIEMSLAVFFAHSELRGVAIEIEMMLLDYLEDM